MPRQPLFLIHPSKHVAADNLNRVREYLEVNRWCTQAQAAYALGLSLRACGEHIRTIKREWLRSRSAARLQEQASAIMDTMAVYVPIGLDTAPCEYSAPPDAPA